MNTKLIPYVVFCSVFLLSGNLGPDIFGTTTTGTVSIIQDSLTISSITADDPDGGDSVFSNGDSIIVKFSGDTNRPDAATKADLDKLFAFSASLGADYSGVWKNPSTLIITIDDSTGHGSPTVGTFTMTLKSAGNLKVAGGQSLASTDQSPVLQGSFGTFSRILFADVDEIVTTTLPSGTTVEITLPVAGGMQITRASASTIIDSGTVTFVGDVIDITPVNGASCTSGCIILITFTQDDLAAGQSSSDVSIFHDTNGDEEFSQSEALSTVITVDNFGVFTANATTFSNSIFAAGTTSSTGESKSGGGGGGGDKTKPSLQSNIISSPDSQIHGGVLKLDDSARANTSIFETGDTIDVELTFYENSGTESLQHVTLFTNIRGHEDRYKSDLYVEWNKNKPIKVHDPENFLNGTADVSYVEESNNVVMTFHLNFVKPMDISHIILNYWDYKRNSGLETFEDTILIIEPVDLTIEESPFENTVADNFIVPPQKEETQPVPSWVKKNAGWWSDGQLEDDVFTNGIQYLIQKKIIDIPILPDASNSSNEEIISYESKTPEWIKNTAKWWSEDMISDEDFVNAIKWLIASKIIVI